MENLFKKGLASLALASVMTSSIFGGNAAHVDVRVKYLSGMGKAVLGYESWDSSKSAYKPGAQKDLVELYIRVLDADGNMADKAVDGSSFVSITIKKNGTNIDYVHSSATNGGAIALIGTSTTNIISREAIGHQNAARYILDYTGVEASKLSETLVINAGQKEKKVNIEFASTNAKGLIVRVTNKSTIDPTKGSNGKYMNANFNKIHLTGDTGLLSIQSTSVEQITAGESVPIRVYASTVASASAGGKFTAAPNLEGKKIIVAAVGDYGTSTAAPDGITNIYLGQTELTMKNGVATGDITIMYGLPDSDTDNSVGDGKFNKKFGGLGVAFIAYVLDTPSINNNNNGVNLSGGVLRTDDSIKIAGDNADTDAIKVKSGTVVGLKGGTFNTSTKVASKLWTGNKTDVFVVNATDISSFTDTAAKSGTIEIVAVDKLGNPATVGVKIATASNVDFKISSDGKTYDSSNTEFTFASSVTMRTGTFDGITKGTLEVTDGAQKVALSKTFSVSYTAGSLAGTPPMTFTAHTVDLTGNTYRDVVGSLSNVIESITVKNTGSTKIYTEQKKEKEYADMKVSIEVVDIADDNISLQMKVLKVQDGTFNSAIKFTSSASRTSKSDKTVGAYKFDVKNSEIVYISTDGDLAGGTTPSELIATIKFDGNVVNTSLGDTTLILKGSQRGETSVSTYRKGIDAYVATTTSTPNAESFVNKDSSPGLPGKTQIDFDFSGDLVDQFVGKAVATIKFAGQEATTTGAANNTNIVVGILGKPFVSTDTIEASANTNTVKAVIPDNGKLSVVLYGGYDKSDIATRNKDANKTRYNIASIKINGFTPIFTSRAKNGLTTAIDIDLNQGHNVTFRAGEVDTAAKVEINGIGAAEVSKKSIDKLPSSANNALLKGKDGVNFTATTSGVFTDSTKNIFTNQKYALFGKNGGTDTNNSYLTVLDTYGNEVKMGSAKISDNYVLTVSDDKCAKVEMASGGKSTDPANIYFEECAAGQQIDLIISVNGNEKAKNTITFTNIVKTIENRKFNVTLDTGKDKYNVVNNDVVIKIQGDGQTGREDTNIVIKSDNPDATVKFVPVDLLKGREFGSMIGSGTKYTDNIKNQGNYYVVTSDKSGTITITADAIIPANQAGSGVAVPLTGTFSFKMADLDLVSPTASAALTAGGVVVTIVDKNLDTEKTKVEIFNDKGVKVTDSAMGASGVYTSKLPRGTYAIEVHAVDLAGNMANIPLSASIGVGGPTEEEEATKTLTAKGKYTVAGTFSSYDFKDVDSSKDWIYTDKDGKVYQLLSIEATASDAFGFGEALTDETVKSTGKNEWYMVQTGEGKFDWALANKDGLAYKLSGVKADGTFKFTGRLSLNAVVSGKTVTFTAK